MNLIKLLALSLSVQMTAPAELAPAGIFSDNAILQRNEPVRVWGTATAGETVTVEFAGQTKSAKANSAGRWEVTLDPMDASAVSREMVFTSSIGKEQVAISGVLVGEVWLGGGQSNMQTTMDYYRVREKENIIQDEIDSANDPLLRMATVPYVATPGKDSTIAWRSSPPGTVRPFSATGYYFAKHLRETLDVPVGIIACSEGSAVAETWMSKDTLANTSDFYRTLEAYDFILNAIENGTATAVMTALTPQMLPYQLYDSMLTRVIPYTIRGVIWYQGERNANTKASQRYYDVFSTLIEEWRQDFKNPDMPFLFVQLASYQPSVMNFHWPELREAQSKVEGAVTNTGMIVLLDGGDELEIHPHSKPLVGYRLSLLARNMVYGETNLVCRGPRLENAQVSGKKIELTFKDCGTGLELRPEGVNDFEICGADGKYVPAQAELVNGKVVVSAAKVSKPEHVRYGWRQWVVPILYNQEGLPASPFRTDSFEETTYGRLFLDVVIGE